MSRLTLRLFGPPRVEVEGRVIEVSRRKAAALLAYLAVTQQSHSRDALAALLWPEASQSRSRASLRSVLWALNKTALEEWLLVEGDTVALCPPPGAGDAAASTQSELEVDVIRFRQLLSAAQRHDHPATGLCPECMANFAEVVSLYENDFLAGFTLPDAPEFDEWVFFQENSLRQDLAAALQSLITFHRAQDEPGVAIPYARRLVALDPLHEAAQRTMMQLYAEAGLQSAALRQYELCRQALESELGLGPSAETTALYEQIQSGAWQGDVAKESKAEGDMAAAGTAVVPHNLPPTTTTFVGREQELATLTTFLEDNSTRLLTITGPGGIGKTRLALAAAASQLSTANFPDGIYFVPLAPLSDFEAIIPAIAEAAGYPFQADKRTPRRQVFDFLAKKKALLLLDNFEHLLRVKQPDGSTLVTVLLQRAQALKILATSREPLNLYEEQRYPLQGLEIANDQSPDAGSEYAAATLFLETARRRRPHFELAPGDSVHLAEICRLAGGMPLALELSASWVEVLSLPEIAAEIRQNLDLMETDVRNVPTRHRSMRAVFDGSWHSLSKAEQDVYARLSVFRGGFTLEAARAVTGASRQSLAALVHKSLLRFNPGRRRYENHELLRQYAAEKLAGATEETRNRHTNYFINFLEQREPDLKGRRQQQALAEIEADGENIASAWHWSVTHSKFGYLARALLPLGLFYQSRGRFEEGATLCHLAVEQLSAALPAAGQDTLSPTMPPVDSSQSHLLVKLLTWQARFNIFLGRYEEARILLGRAQLALEQLPPEEPGVAATKAFLLLHLADPSTINDFGGKAVALNEESLQLYRSLDNSWGIALALDALSQKKMNLGLREEAIRLHEECLAIRQRLEDKQGIARSYSLLGLFSLHMGQLERSEAYLRKSLSLFRTLDNRATLSNPLALLGINLLFAGRFEESIVAYEEAWTIHRALGIANEPFTANVATTRAKIDLGRYEEARTKAEVDLVTYRASNHQWAIAFTLFNLGRLDLVEGDTRRAQQRMEESVEILQKMNESSLLPEALFCLAYPHLALQERDQAVQCIIRALKIAIATESLSTMRFELPAMALLHAGQGQPEQAIEFYAAALQSPYIANSRWFDEVAGRHISALAASMPQHTVVAAQERGRARNLWETANALLAELSAQS